VAGLAGCAVARRSAYKQAVRRSGSQSVNQSAAEIGVLLALCVKHVMGVVEVVGDDTFSYSVACWCGIALSVYALWVEVQKHRNPQYVAICDLGDNMQCSRVLTSQ